MSRKCWGNSAGSRSASRSVRYRMRRIGSLSIRTVGARSSHCHARAHCRRIDRTSASVLLLTVALLQRLSNLACDMRSIMSRLIVSSSLPPRCWSSQRSFALSSSDGGQEATPGRSVDVRRWIVTGSNMSAKLASMPPWPMCIGLVRRASTFRAPRMQASRCRQVHATAPRCACLCSVPDRGLGTWGFSIEWRGCG